MASTSAKKRFSINSELRAVFTLAHDGKAGSQQAASILLSSLTPDHFVTPVGELCFRRIRHLLKTRGELPEVDDLFEDPGIDADTRTSLQAHFKSGLRGLRDADKARRLMRRLETFRKVRALFSIGANLEAALSEDEVDPEDILSKLATSVTNAASSERSMRVTSRGDGNSTLAVAKKILMGDGPRFIPTGIEAFDSVNSGIPRGAFMLIETVTGGGKCLTGDSLVYTNKGTLSLEELWELRGQSIGQGFYALPNQTVVRNHLNKKVVAKGIYRKQDKTRRVEFDFGLSITGTDQHRLWTYDQETFEFSWKTLAELKEGDWLPRTLQPNLYQQRPYQPGVRLSLDLDWSSHMKGWYYYKNTHYLPTTLPIAMNEDLAGLFGYMVAEGHGTAAFCNTDTEVLDDYSNRYNRLFGISPSAVEYKGRISALRNCAIVADFFAKNGLSGAASAFKEVPLTIRRSYRNIQAEFLRCLFEGDGYITADGKISYTTVSKRLADQIFAMLDNMGIKTYRRSKDIRHKTSNPDASTVYNIIIHSHSRSRFAELIGFVSSYKQDRLNEYVSRDNVFNTTCPPAALLAHDMSVILRDHLWDRISSDNKPYIRRLARNALKFTKDHLYKLQSILEADGLGSSLAHIAQRRGLRLPLKSRVLLNQLLEYDWVQVRSNQPTGKMEWVYDLYVPEGNSYQVNGLSSHNSTMVSALAEKMAMFGAHVGIVPLEMNTEEMVMRDMARASGVDMTDLIAPKKKMSPKARKKAYRAYKERTIAMDKRGGSVKIIEPGGDVDIQTLLHEARVFDFDVIMIDYVGLLKGAEGDRQWQELGNITRYCKIWAGLHNCVVIMAAQLSAEGLLRYSRTMEEHASYAWAWLPNELSKEQGIFLVEQRKARQAKQFEFPIKIDFATMDVRDPTRQEYANFLDMMEELTKKRKNSKQKRHGDNGGPDEDDDYDYKKDPTYSRKEGKRKDEGHGGGKWSPNYRGGGSKSKGNKTSRNRFDEEF